MNYLLMNKDQPVLTFSTVRNAFDEVEAIEHHWFHAARPIGFINLTAYLESRKAPKHRKHIADLLTRYGCNDLEGFLRITHALSLNDTFWVKEESSELSWSAVSLYTNEFDELVSTAAFDGRFSSTSLSTTSPEFGTDGLFAKCWARDSGQIYLYKSGSTTFEIEPLSEYLTSQLARHICPHSVSYDLDFYHDRLISKCGLFTSEEVGLVKTHDLIPREKRTVSNVLHVFEQMGSGDAFRRMCVLDALTLNVDRHYGNFGALVNNDTMEILEMAPVYDNNRCLLFDMDINQLKQMDWCIGTCTPRFGSDFIATARGMLTDEIHQDLKNLQDFAFMQHPQISAEQERLELLSAIVRYQIQKILK